MTETMTLDYRNCICRFDGMICTVEATCPIHGQLTAAPEDGARLCPDCGGFVGHYVTCRSPVATRPSEAASQKEGQI